MGPFVWDSLSFLDLCVFFLHQIREVLTHYFFKYVLDPLLTLFLGIQMLLYFMLPQRFLKLSLFFEFVFLYVTLIRWFFFSTLSSHVGCLFVFVSRYYVDLQRRWHRPMSIPACAWLWAICWELSVINSMCFLLLSLFMCRKNQTAHPGQLLSAPGPWEGLPLS